jgi:RND family efflux transporter MFP subunit
MARLAIAVTIGLAAAGLSGCGGNRDHAAPPARQPIAVTIVPVAAVDTAERLEAGGIVSAHESAMLSSRIVATVVTVRARAGDRVRAGQIVVTLDAREATDRTRQAGASVVAAEKAVAQARAEQGAADAEQRLATAWRTRIGTLHAKRSATDQERDEADARFAAAAARVDRAKAGFEGAEAALAAAQAGADVASTSESFATLRAPFDGVVTERLTDPGNLATPGLPLVRIESSARLEVAVRVDEARAAAVRGGDRVDVAIEASGDAAGAAAPFEAMVTEVSRAGGVDQRSFTVTIALPSTVTARTGTFARVFFRGPPRRMLQVPAAAIRRYGQVTSVFVVEDNVARLRLVQTGVSTPAGIEVLAGVDAGEPIVSAPPAGLEDGSPVTVTSARRGTAGAP